MKNTKQNQLKKCICVSLDEFDKIIRTIFNEKAHVTCDYEGLSIDYADDTDGLFTDDHDVLAALSEYFDTDVTSYHCDNCELNIGVWICYKEKL